jgi:hypothetical protein
MAKTNQIGVRFDLDLWEQLDKMGYSTAQRKLNFLEGLYILNLEKVVAFNNLEEEKNKINKEREPIKPIEQKKIVTEKECITQKPERMKGEDSVDYAGRVNEWKKSLNK